MKKANKSFKISFSGFRECWLKKNLLNTTSIFSGKKKYTTNFEMLSPNGKG